MMTMTAILCLLLLSSIASVTAFGPSITSSTSPVHAAAEICLSFASPRIHPTKNFARHDSRLFQSSNNGNAGQQQTLIERQEEAYLQLPTASFTNNKPDVVYIIMYHPGSQEEGVHTTEFPKESGQEVMLAFESLDEINTFANMLREEPTFPLDPVPTPAPLANMEVACQQMGLVMKLVPA